MDINEKLLRACFLGESLPVLMMSVNLVFEADVRDPELEKECLSPTGWSLPSSVSDSFTVRIESFFVCSHDNI